MTPGWLWGRAPAIHLTILDVFVSVPNTGVCGRLVGGTLFSLFSSEGASWGFFPNPPLPPPPRPSPLVFRATELSPVGGQPRLRVLPGDLGFTATFPTLHRAVTFLSPFRQLLCRSPSLGAPVPWRLRPQLCALLVDHSTGHSAGHRSWRGLGLVPQPLAAGR